jgi:hypothetical protein
MQPAIDKTRRVTYVFLVSKSAPGGDAMTDAGAQATPDLTKTVPICLQLGWTMAVLYSILRQAAVEHPTTPDLPQAPDLGWAKFRPDTAPATKAWWGAEPGTDPGIALTPPGEEDFLTRAKALLDVLPAFHLSVLTEFTKCGPEVGLGYQVGRSLRDSVNPAASRNVVSPADEQAPPEGGGGDSPGVDLGAVAVNRMQNGLGRDRVAVIQKWLATLAPQFPANAAKIVSSSLGRWSDFAYVTLEEGGPGRLRRDSTGRARCGPRSPLSRARWE